MKDFKLDKGPKIESGFSTPESYFDDFQQRLMQHLPVQEPKVISIFAKRRAWIISVAAVLTVVIMLPVYNNLSKSQEEIDTISMENYLAYQSNISQYDLINLLDTEDIQSLNMDMAIEDQAIEDILTNTNNLENYIYEN